jgi:hypothetical protein
MVNLGSPQQEEARFACRGRCNATGRTAHGHIRVCTSQTTGARVLSFALVKNAELHVHSPCLASIVTVQAGCWPTMEASRTTVSVGGSVTRPAEVRRGCT